MPEDSKKNHDKKRNDPKEQRKPRNPRNQANKADKKADMVEESRSAPKVTVPQKPPVYQDPGPEFYKNLKRETEEILKITEEESSKYKKKEIQSNWSKYEMPIETYEDIDEQDVGADYEKLIQAPLSIGGHFQFKHEKSWDVNTGPSLYDKYFEINMDNLSLAVSTVPFFERNEIDTTLFSETDMLTMKNRATKYKQKYFEDKSFSTAETEAQEKILNSLKESLSKNKIGDSKNNLEENIEENSTENRSEKKDDIDLDFKNLPKTDYVPSPVHSTKVIKELDIQKPSMQTEVANANKDEIDDLLVEEKPKLAQSQHIVDPPESMTEISKKIAEPVKIPTTPSVSVATKSKDNSAEVKKNPVIESPEDLEKWLDDFLDG